MTGESPTDFLKKLLRKILIVIGLIPHPTTTGVPKLLPPPVGKDEATRKRDLELEKDSAPKQKPKKPGGDPPPKPPPSERGHITEKQMGGKVNELAKARGMRVTRQGGFARIGVMSFIAIATSAGIILASEDKLDAVIELAKGTASDVALGALFLKASRSVGVAGILTMVVGMETDSARENEYRAKARMIEGFVCSEFRDVCDPYYRDWGFWESDVWYEGNGSPEYWDIYKKVQQLVDNPYKFENIAVPTNQLPNATQPQKERLWTGRMQ